MSTNAVLFGWKRSLPGREALSAKHFQDFMGYLQGLKQRGDIESFEPVLIQPYGGDLNGFFFIKGDGAKLAAVTGSSEWLEHQIRGLHHLDGQAILRAVTGPMVGEHMAMWTQGIPK